VWEKGSDSLCVCMQNLPDRFSVCCKHTEGYTVHSESIYDPLIFFLPRFVTLQPYSEMD
jgi:hypothetical protein